MQVDQLALELAIVRTEGLLHMLRRAKEAQGYGRIAVVNDTLREADGRLQEIAVQIQDMRGR